MQVFIISSVRGVDSSYQKKLEKYTEDLENKGIVVYLPHRDTNQSACSLNICETNLAAIQASDEVHIFYNPKSQGTHFDMGIAFALNKPIKVIETVEFGSGKSYPRMLKEWQDQIELVNA